VTSAEARNVDATVEEFEQQVRDAVGDARGAGLSADQVSRSLIMAGVLLALDAGVPTEGLHDIFGYVKFLTEKTVKHFKADKESP